MKYGIKGQVITHFFTTEDPSDQFQLKTITGISGNGVNCVKVGSDTPTIVGVVLTVDYLGITGLHRIQITTTDDFYIMGGQFMVKFIEGAVGTFALAGRLVFEFTLDLLMLESLRANNAYAALQPVTPGELLAVTSGALGTGAINNTSFSTAAITAIQSGLATNAAVDGINTGLTSILDAVAILPDTASIEVINQAVAEIFAQVRRIQRATEELEPGEVTGWRNTSDALNPQTIPVEIVKL